MDKGNKKGFTLVELLIAIVIIGILMSMLIPAVSKVMENARRTKGASCLKQIVMAYSQYCNDDVNGRNINVTDGTKGIGWALVLAKSGHLNDPNMYCFSGDSGATKVVKKSIVDATLGDNQAWGTGTVEFSVYLINNIPMDAPLTTTPVAFTRGIPKVTNGSNAKWPTTGVYGDKGGYIGFLDGHVEWFDDLGTNTDGKLMVWGGTGTTNDIFTAIPGTAQIFSASAIVANE
ncbi:MAG: type II secretion system GspH family protein [Puniceicoccales bacterium]|jgi:prepilin-type N-terminal cleavage/methylation domain-containing protein/prepilin-type processing-associated H-X9-DG protein|nr:type II secretion system GspH family protein [Puniceicoccales bacterium]